MCTVQHAVLIHNSLYDMDIVFDPPGSGQFREVYLYEELMEADLHAIVSTLLLNIICKLIAGIDSIWTTSFRRALPIILISNSLWPQGALIPLA